MLRLQRPRHGLGLRVGQPEFLRPGGMQSLRRHWGAVAHATRSLRALSGRPVLLALLANSAVAGVASALPPLAEFFRSAFMSERRGRPPNYERPSKLKHERTEPGDEQ